MSTDLKTLKTSEISEKSNQLHTLTFSPYRSHALDFLLLEMVKDLKKKTLHCGMMRRESLAWYCPNTWLLKTAQRSIEPDLELYSDALPSSGIMQNGHIYRATNLGFSNVVNDYILLPTPVKADWKAPHGRAHYFGNLRKGRGYHLPVYIRDGENDGIYPNPELTEVLMTFPAGYTDLQVQEMPLFHLLDATF